MTISIEELERQVRVLRDIEEIKRLKHAYFRCIDTVNLEELRGLTHPEVTTCYVGGSYRLELADREEFIEMIASSFHAECVARHNGHHPEIEVTSETEASGTWYLHDDFLNLREMIRTEGTAIYRDRYLKVDGRWLIRHQSYERIFERVEPITTVPKFTVNTLARTGRRLPKQG
ncbi:MAG: nuclear transport factor 2 family protein [Steroidobacteraceae bacterium]